MYKQTLSPKPMPWYMSIAMVLIIVISLWFLVFLHNLSFYLFPDHIRAIIDVVLLLIACIIAYAFFVGRCTHQEYILQDGTLSLLSIRGGRMVKRQDFPVDSITLAPADKADIPHGKKLNRFCYKGHPDALVISSGNQNAVFAPNKELLAMLKNNGF